MKTYCVRQKKETSCVSGSERIVTARNGRQMVVCTCSECGITKTQFVRNDGSFRQTGRGKSKSDYTCGIDPYKKPYSAKECINKGQIRYWRKEKIPPKLFELIPTKPFKIPRLSKIEKDLIDPITKVRYKALMRDYNKMNKIKPKTVKKIRVPKLPKVKDVYDPSIDARYEALMSDYNKMKKPMKPLRIPKLPKVKDVYDPSIDARYKALMRDYNKMKKPMKKKKAEENTKKYIKEIVNKIEDGSAMYLDDYDVVHHWGVYYIIDLNEAGDDGDIDYDRPSTYEEYTTGSKTKDEVVDELYEMFKNKKKLKPKY